MSVTNNLLNIDFAPSEPFGQDFNRTVVPSQKEVLHVLEVVCVRWVERLLILVGLGEPPTAPNYTNPLTRFIAERQKPRGYSPKELEANSCMTVFCLEPTGEFNRVLADFIGT